MTFKTLLLGSAAALLTVGGAQAADLAVAQPVSYVKVCDVFGAGYWYSPGTQTCLRIGGYVREELFIATLPGAPSTPWGITSSTGETFANPYLSQANHEFVTNVAVNFTAMSMTEMGALTGYVQFVGTTGNATSSTSTTANGISIAQDLGGEPLNLVTLDEAYISWGPFLAGYTGSLYVMHGSLPLISVSQTAASNNDQVRFSWASGPVGIAVAAEDYRNRDTLYGGGANPSTGKTPDLTALLTAKAGLLDLRFAAAWGNRQIINTWGALASAEINLDALTKGDRLRLGVLYSANGSDWIGSGTAIGGGNGNNVSNWGALVQFKHMLTPALAFDIAGSYTADNLAVTTQAAASISADLSYTLAPNLKLTGGIVYSHGQATASTPYVTAGQVRLERAFP